MSPDLAFTSVTQQAALVAEGAVTSRALVEHSLARIARLDSRLRAFTRVLVDQALAEADARDAAQAAGEPLGPLHGVPIAIKDENDVAGTPTTFGTNAVTRVQAADSEVVRRLRAAGAVIIGKTAMPEFGLWPYTESATYGYTRNPWNPSRSVGGSSGGTAAAVASGMVAAGIGGDGGGSIRLPSSWCGLFGLKPQRGRVTAAPNAALWGALGTIGPLTRTVADSARLFDVISGATEVDRYRAQPWPEPLEAFVGRDPGRLRIRVVEGNPAGGPAPDTDTLGALRATAAVLAGLGHQVETGTLPPYRPGLAFLQQVAAGVRSELPHIDEPRKLERRTRQALALTRALAGGAAAGERKSLELADTVNAVFGEVDLVVMATTPSAAVSTGQLEGLGFAAATPKATAAASLTALWNVLGNPAAAVPAGWDAAGLPLSVQLVGPWDSEPLIVQVASQLESARPWTDRQPDLSRV